MKNSFIKIFFLTKKALMLLGVSLLILLSCFFWHSCYKHFLNTFEIEKKSLQSTRTKNSESLESKIVESFIYDSCNWLLVYIKKTPTMYLEVKSILDKEKREHLNLTDLAKDIKPNSDKILIRQSEFMRQYQESVKIQKENAEIENNSGSNFEKKYFILNNLNNKADLPKMLNKELDSQKPKENETKLAAFKSYVIAQQNDKEIFVRDYLNPSGQGVSGEKNYSFSFDKIEKILDEHTRKESPKYNLYFCETYFANNDIKKKIQSTNVKDIPLTKDEIEQLAKSLKIQPNNLKEDQIDGKKEDKRKNLLKKLNDFAELIKTGISK